MKRQKPIFFKTNSMATLEMLVNSPSRKDGITLQSEEFFRQYGCLIIQSSGILMKLPQVVMASAMVLFQRVYCILSFKSFFIKDAVMGCLLLASKTEESLRKVRDIISTVEIVIKNHRGYPLKSIDCSSSEFLNLKEDMITSEMKILRSLGFNVQVQLPYGLLINYLQSLGIVNHDKIPQLAWNYLNDALCTKLYICFQPNTIACAAIYISCKKYEIILPSSPPWYEIFDVEHMDLMCAVIVIKDIYTKNINNTAPVNKKEMELYLSGQLDSYMLREKELLMKSQLLKNKLNSKIQPKNDQTGKNQWSEKCDNQTEDYSRRDKNIIVGNRSDSTSSNISAAFKLTREKGTSSRQKSYSRSRSKSPNRSRYRYDNRSQSGDRDIDSENDRYRRYNSRSSNNNDRDRKQRYKSRDSTYAKVTNRYRKDISNCDSSRSRYDKKRSSSRDTREHNESRRSIHKRSNSSRQRS